MIMRYLIFLFVTLCIVSCHNNYNPDEIDDDISYLNCEQVYDNGNYFANCEEMIDTVGLKLYSFIPFTDEEKKVPGYRQTLRQIPEDFLHGMTTKELFYQIVFTDVCGDMFLVDKVDKRYNMVTELLNRPDASHVLLELLRKYVPQIEEIGDCFHWCYLFELFISQPEIINSMTDEDICTYIHHLLRCHEILRTKCQNSADQPCYTAYMLFIWYGLGNVMIRYEFEPFMQIVPRRQSTNEIAWSPSRQVSEDFILRIIDYVEQFINKKP